MPSTSRRFCLVSAMLSEVTMSKNLDKAIKLCDASNYSRSFFSRKQAEAFVEQLKKQGIKAIITAAADPLNKGSVMYRVEWN